MTFTAETAAEPAARSTRPGGLKPLFVRGLLLCLSTTAAIGIYALLAGEFHETGVRVLTSTLLVGVFCMLCLADVGVLEGPHRAVGSAGISCAGTALVQGLFLIWAVAEDEPGHTWFLVARGCVLAGIVAVALAHAALLLQIDLAGSNALAGVRAATLTTMGVVALMLCAPLIEVDLADTDGYWRLVGALAILDVLGTVSLPVLARFGIQNSARSTR